MCKRYIRERVRETRDTTIDPRHGDHIVAGVAPAARSLRPASVLIALVEKPRGFGILLTKRTEHLAHHPGQVSFPGGRVEPDDSDAVATALREAREEIGLDAGSVEVVGTLERYQTATGFIVTPIVGFVAPPVRLKPDPNEVEEVFELPLEFVLDANNHRLDSRLVKGRWRSFYVLPYRHYYIWGATAAMLVNFAKRLNQRKNDEESSRKLGSDGRDRRL